jgi:hypothetical protein
MRTSILPDPVPDHGPTAFSSILASLFVLFVAIRKKMDLVHALTGRRTPRARSGGGHNERHRV